MIKAIMQGESDAQTLTELARGSLRGKLPQLQQALEGRIQPHHRVLLQQIFAPLQFLETSMQQVLQEVEAQMEPYQAVVELWASASRRTSSGSDGLCFGGGHRSEPVS